MVSATTSRTMHPAIIDATSEPALVTMYSPMIERPHDWLGEPEIAVRYFGQPPPWITQVVERLSMLLELGKNWDSYGAQAVERAAAASCLSFLVHVMLPTSPVPFLVPTPPGGVSAEWHDGDTELELQIDPDQAPYAVYVKDDDEQEWYVDSSAAISEFAKALRALGSV